jgi:hypothetical protein
MKGDIFVCKKCNGFGRYTLGKETGFKSVNCEVCDGKGHLDWIEKIVGKKKTIKPLEFKIDNVDLQFDDSFYKAQREILDEMSKQMAYSIDKMILEEMVKKPTKIYGQEPVKNYGRKRR